MRRFLFFITISIISLESFSQRDNLHYPISVSTISGYSGSSDAVNSLLPHFTLFASYTNSLFIPEVGLTKIKMVYPSKKVCTTASLSFYGYKDYWTIDANIGFSKYFKPYIAFGVEAFFRSVRFSLTENTLFTGGANVSLVIFPIKSICIGVYAENITFSPLVHNSVVYRLPVIFCLGISYKIKDNTSLTIECRKSLSEPFLICGEVEYAPVKKFVMRLGASYMSNASLLFGIGVRFKRFFLDFDAQYDLGVGVGCKAVIGIK